MWLQSQARSPLRRSWVEREDGQIWAREESVQHLECLGDQRHKQQLKDTAGLSQQASLPPSPPRPYWYLGNPSLPCLQLSAQLSPPHGRPAGLPNSSFPVVISSHLSLSLLIMMVVYLHLWEGLSVSVSFLFWFFRSFSLCFFHPFFFSSFSILSLGYKHLKTSSGFLFSPSPALCSMHLGNYKYWMPCVSPLWGRATQVLRQQTGWSKTESWLYWVNNSLGEEWPYTCSSLSLEPASQPLISSQCHVLEQAQDWG